MREFNQFYQILLSLFDILNVFYDNILVNIKTKMCQTVQTIQILSLNGLAMSDQLNKIWLKGLNLRISKDKRLNLSKF